MPELTSSFRPAWWLPGPHLPTIWGKFGRRRAPVHDRTERWTTPDDDHLTLLRLGRITSGVPHLLILHGLEAKPTAKYAHGLLATTRRLGWSGDLLLFRTCDGEVNRARRFYHSGETTDCDFVIRRLLAQHADLHLVVVGVSLGGNVLLKWLGECGRQVPAQVRRAAAVSVPFDLAAGSRFMEYGFSRVYVRHFLRSLRAKTLAKLERYPDLCSRERLLAARTFWEFDDAVTGPVHGFRDAREYYERSSCISFLQRVAVPTLLLGARNDPFVPAAVLSRVRQIVQANPHLHLEVTEGGGHVGWVAGEPSRPRYYMEERVVGWLGMKEQ